MTDLLALALIWALYGMLILFVWLPILAIIISFAAMLIDWFRK